MHGEISIKKDDSEKPVEIKIPIPKLKQNEDDSIVDPAEVEISVYDAVKLAVDRVKVTVVDSENNDSLG